jgi:hypothetical protein
MAKNILIFIHGMTGDSNPEDPVTGQYAKLINAVEKEKKGVINKFSKKIFVKWGALYGTPPPGIGDQRLDKAEELVSTYSGDDYARALPGNDWTHQWRDPISSALWDSIKYSVISKGLSDALYYSAPDGESLIRSKIYGDLIQAIQPLMADPDEIRIHLVTHSLGVAVGHDFVYALFNPQQKSEFVKGASFKAGDTVKASFQAMQQRVSVGSLKLGSFVGMASQLPLFVMRSQKLVEHFAQGKHFDPNDIGVDPNTGEVVIKFFYDPDDLLGFPSRGLYEPNIAIQDVRVQTGQLPNKAHTDYWWNGDVAKHLIELWDRRAI